MGSPLNPKARKVGKRSSGGSGDTSKGGGSESSHKLDPKAVQTYGAFCGECGALGNYLDQASATNAENLHQQRRHANSPHKSTTSVEAQKKRNKGGGK